METLKRKAPGGPAPADNASPLKAPRADAAEPPARTTLAAAEPIACVHDVSYPEGYDAAASASRVLAGGAERSEPAKKFPFQLDPFQAEAIRCLDNGESVMVTTSEVLSCFLLSACIASVYHARGQKFPVAFVHTARCMRPAKLCFF